MVHVKVIADSVSSSGVRISTFVVSYWRAIHSEILTHRVFSRNASSSRAIPVKTMIKQVRENPAGPIHWGKNIPGMQAKEELSGLDLEAAKTAWKVAARQAADMAETMMDLGLHKQVANRVLEPFQYIHVVLTATDFENFFELRDHEDAQPEIAELAREMKKALGESTHASLADGEWHIPFVTDAEKMLFDLSDVLKMSTARCARVSYLKHDGTSPEFEKDCKLHDDLVSSRPIHASPTEHQAQSMGNKNRYKNFVGFKQYRHIVEELVSQK